MGLALRVPYAFIKTRDGMEITAKHFIKDHVHACKNCGDNEKKIVLLHRRKSYSPCTKMYGWYLVRCWNCGFSASPESNIVEALRNWNGMNAQINY
jgi:hypothetical protein